MQKFRVILNNLFDYLLIDILLVLALALVIPFPSIFVGVVHYFERERDDRRLKDIFSIYKDNWPILIKYSIYIIIGYAASLADIILLREPTVQNIIFNILGYTLLIFVTISLINGPILILHMNLTFFQLLFNSFTLIFGKWYLFLLIFIIYAGIAVGCIFFPYISPLFPVILAALASYSTRINFNILKQKALEKRGESESEENSDEEN